MNILTRSSLILFIVLTAKSSIGFGAQPPDVVASDANGNTAMGTSALASLAGGVGTTAAGYFALSSNTSGSHNTAFGYWALFANVTGNDNVAVGSYALRANTTGNYNSAIGSVSLYNNTTGSTNTATGYAALEENTTGNSNSAFGNQALFSNSIGSSNTAFGANALNQSTTGSYNTVMGTSAALYNSSGRRNVAMGYSALSDNSSGHGNTAIGAYAGQHTTGNDNVMVANRGSAGESQTMRLGTQGTEGQISSGVTRTFIAGIRGVTTGSAGAAVLIDSKGQLGTISSSRRFKEDIRDMADASERLLQLRPVTFRYKRADAAGEHTMQYGLIAEEVAEVFPELVIPNEAGQPETVAYHLLPSLLLNEVQKEHRLVQQQADQLVALASQLAELREQLARLQSQSKEEQVAMK